MSGTSSLSATDQYVGYSGTGDFVQSGGTNGASYYGGLYLGYNSGAGGTYNLSGTGTLNANSQYVGYSGTGDLHPVGRKQHRRRLLPRL